jgi:hypothetical protein
MMREYDCDVVEPCTRSGRFGGVLKTLAYVLEHSTDRYR